jgi:WD40 repeat protein
VTFSPDGRRLASAPDGGLYPPNSDLNTIHIWDAETGALQHKLIGHSGAVQAIAFSPDGLWLVSAASNDTVRIWDSEKGALQKKLETHCQSIRSITFSPDGGRLASASSDNKARIYNFRTGAIEQTLEGHSQWVDAVTFSPDGGRLASASRDDTVRIWNAETGALEQTFRTGVSEETWFGSYGSVKAMTFSPDEQQLITTLGSMELVNSNSGLHSAKWPSYSLPNVDRCWIMWNECKILWLPVEYRPACQIFHGNFLAMGHKSGRVTIIKFRAELKPI